MNFISIASPINPQIILEVKFRVFIVNRKMQFASKITQLLMAGSNFSCRWPPVANKFYEVLRMRLVSMRLPFKIKVKFERSPCLRKGNVTVPQTCCQLAPDMSGLMKLALLFTLTLTVTVILIEKTETKKVANDKAKQNLF